MHPVHDVDALLLLATALSSKRRPAELVEVVAAAELISGALPEASKLAAAFVHLSTHGVIVAQDGGFALSPDGQQLVVGEPRKAEAAERIFWLRDQLSVYRATPGQPAIAIDAAAIEAAILVHQAAVKESKKNLMVPKPKPPADTGRGPGFKQRKPMPARRRKA